MTGWVWGHARCFVDDTINELLALSPRYVAALGVRCVLVWRRADGERVYTAARGDRPRGGWFDDLKDRLYLRTGEAVVEIDLATGDSRERAPRADDPATAAVERDRSGTAATVTWPDGHVLEVSYPHELVAGISCAEEVVAVPHGVRAVDVLGRDGALRWTFKNYQRAVLSPDGREIALVGVVSKRIVFADVETGVVDAPGVPSFNIEALELSPDGARLLVIAGGYAWLLDPATGRPIVRLEAVASPRLLGDSVIDVSARFVAGGTVRRRGGRAPAGPLGRGDGGGRPLVRARRAVAGPPGQLRRGRGEGGGARGAVSGRADVRAGPGGPCDRPRARV